VSWCCSWCVELHVCAAGCCFVCTAGHHGYLKHPGPCWWLCVASALIRH
jgi:hypothetical protein